MWAYNRKSKWNENRSYLILWICQSFPNVLIGQMTSVSDTVFICLCRKVPHIKEGLYFLSSIAGDHIAIITFPSGGNSASSSRQDDKKYSLLPWKNWVGSGWIWGIYARSHSMVPSLECSRGEVGVPRTKAQRGLTDRRCEHACIKKIELTYSLKSLFKIFI